MTTAVVDDLQVSSLSRSLAGRLAVAGMASMGAGAIHAAAIGVHAEHRQSVIAFAGIAAFQVGWGAFALTQGTRVLGLLGAAGNAAVIGGFALAKTTGIPFVDGLEGSESIQLADGAAAALAIAAVAAVVVGLWASSGFRLRRFLAPTAAMVVAALAIPSMVAAGTHRHAETETSGGASHGHDGGATAAAGHGATAAPVVKPYDPTKPIDLSGTDGVTPEQQARAENLIAITLDRLPKFADPAVAFAAGFRSIGDAGTGYEHYVNWSYLDDDKLLDPDHPESLVYRAHRDGRRELQAAMFMLTTKDTLDTVPDIGGALTQWHVHEDLCFTDEPGNYQVRNITRTDGSCPAPLVKPAQAPMIHVWTVAHPCGPFAALEGIGAGQIKPGETRLCDHAHGA